MHIAVLASGDALRVLKRNVGMSHGPTPGTPGGGEALGGKCRIEALIAAGCDRHNRCKIGRRTGAFERRRSSPDHVAGEQVSLRHDEFAKLLAGLLVPHTAVVPS